MKKIALLSGMLWVALLSNAQKFQFVSQTEEGVTFSHELRQQPFQYVNINGTNCIDFSKTNKVVSLEQGAPALPMFTTTVQLPAHGNTVLVVEYDAVTEIPNVEVAPSKGNLKRNADPSTIAYSFGEVYQQNAFYPASVATLNDPFIWRTMRGQTVTLSPYQYNPVTKVLRVHENLRVRVIFQTEIAGLNEVAVSRPDNLLGQIQQTVCINGVVGAQRYTPIDEDGEMLVITDPAYVSDIQTLVDWKNQKGIKTTVVTTDVTGTVDTDIKTYIQNYYASNPDMLYILLVGDHASVPSHTYGTSSDGEALWSDSYYGQLAGGSNDYYLEAFVGRYSGNSSDIRTMVNRNLEYEKNPAPGDWMEKAIGLGSGEGSGIGDNGEADWQHLRNIRTRLMSYGYTTVHEFYDGSRGGEDASGNPNSTIILPAVNDGVGLFNYTGHGAQNVCVTGNFSSSNINSATNNGKYPLVVSVACNNGTFTSGTCISESWMRADNASTPSGAIGAAGSSILMSWAPPMQTQDEMTEIIALAYPNNQKVTTGGLFYNAQMSMLEQYSGGSYGREVVQTWVFFGDPSTMFRNKQTMSLTATHAAQVPQSATSLTVNCDVEGALVAISQENVLLGKGIVSGGSVTINFPSLATDMPLMVTATKQNYGTYQGPVQVGSGPVGLDELEASIVVYPNPSSDVVTVISSGGTLEQVELINTAGQVISTYAANGMPVTIQLNHLSAGSYFAKVTTTSGVVMKRVEVIK